MPVEFQSKCDLIYMSRDENGNIQVPRKSLQATDVEMQCESGEYPVLSIGNEVCTFTFTLTRLQDRKTWSDIFMLPKWKSTEFCFPKKKPRGTMRRKRRQRRSE